MITTEEAARITGLTTNQISWLARKGKIEAQKFGRDWAISRASAIAYAREWHKPGPKREEGSQGG
ncbi:MAG TPA: helix-turn-helix domain-containing protein [Ktedonobacterales bacterium]|nr:helix-turn-helix domain-containing protein [Ktedonobacterales bacterium]